MSEKVDTFEKIEKLNKLVEKEPLEGHKKRGRAYFKKGEYSLASKDFTNAIKISKDANLYYRRGRCYKKQSKFKQAHSDFTKALELNKDELEYIKERGLVGLKLQKESALQELESYLKTKKDDYFVLCKLGKGYMKIESRKNLDNAMKHLNNAIILKPKKPRAYCLRGQLFELKQKYKEALEDLNKSIDIDRKQVEFYRARSSVLRVLEKREEEIHDLKLCIKLEIKNFYNYYALAKAYVFYGDDLKDLPLSQENERTILYEKSVKHYGDAIELSPITKRHAIISDRVKINVKLGRTDDSINDYTELIKTVPVQMEKKGRKKYILELTISRGDQYLLMHDFENAKRDFLFVVNNLKKKVERKIKAEDVMWLNNYGNYLIKAGRVDKSLTCFTECLRIQPDYEYALSSKGAALYILGEDEKCLKYLDKALSSKIKDVSAEPWYFKSLLLKSNGKDEESQSLYEQAEKVNKDEVIALKLLYELYDDFGRKIFKGDLKSYVEGKGRRRSLFGILKKEGDKNYNMPQRRAVSIYLERKSKTDSDELFGNYKFSKKVFNSITRSIGKGLEFIGDHNVIYDYK